VIDPLHYFIPPCLISTNARLPVKIEAGVKTILVTQICIENTPFKVSL